MTPSAQHGEQYSASTKSSHWIVDSQGNPVADIPWPVEGGHNAMVANRYKIITKLNALRSVANPAALEDLLLWIDNLHECETPKEFVDGLIERFIKIGTLHRKGRRRDE